MDPGHAPKLQAAPKESGRPREPAQAAAVPEREGQVFAFLTRGLGEGLHREFIREIDRM